MRILLTGATGQVGGHLLWRLWRSGHEVWAIVRPESLSRWPSLLSRVQRLFGPVSPELIAPRALPGHLWLPSLGIVSDWVNAHRGRFDAVVHAAADTRLRPADESELHRTNVEGTLRVAALAEALGAPHLVHLSTLFVAGHAPGPFTERDLDCGQTFRCAYERTKFDAERRLRRWADTRAITLTCLRPGIVVGDSATGASLEYPHFYGFLRGLRLFLDSAPPGDAITVPFDPQARPALVCVDTVSAVILATVEGRASNIEGRSTLDHRTLHLFDPSGPTLAALWETHAGAAGAGRLRLDPAHPFRVPPSGRALGAWFAAHLPHLAEPGRFACDATQRWCADHGVTMAHLDEALLRRLEETWAHDAMPSLEDRESRVESRASTIDLRPSTPDPRLSPIDSGGSGQ
jgi:nucleoside-diphosphate-sugar epimerase